jgi:hypothetical protein
MLISDDILYYLIDALYWSDDGYILADTAHLFKNRFGCILTYLVCGLTQHGIEMFMFLRMTYPVFVYVQQPEVGVEQQLAWFQVYR